MSDLNTSSQQPSRDEILRETESITGSYPVAYYTSTPYEIFGDDDQPVETTCTVNVRLFGSDELGYTLHTSDDADGASDDLGSEVYPTQEAAFTALETLLSTRTDGYIDQRGILPLARTNGSLNGRP